MTSFLSRLFACALPALLFPIVVNTANAETDPSRPNIVYIMADELGYYELSSMGSETMQTPNIDKFAKEGMRFTQGLAGSCVCAPTRCCLMTGKHSGHTSVRSNGGGTPMRKGEKTIASLLKKRGYATGGFGKWGCGGRGSTGVPEDHGFDVFLGYYDQVHAHSYYPPYIVRNSEEVELKNNHGGSNGETYSHYVIYEAAKDFIRTNKDKPFFCYMPITPPHGIFDIPDSDPSWKVFKDKDWPEQARRYAAMVHMVDRQVGEVLQLLRELELEENTLVIFCGDNGGNDYFRDDKHPRGFHSANKDPKTGVEFRGTKGTLYEGGLRIPMMARWPGKIKPGQVSDLLWYFPDVLPTVSQLAGADTPKDVDGVSIVPTLLGQGEQKLHDFLYWEIGSQIAIRQGDWKAVLPRGKKPQWQLFDLKADISEANDLAESNPDMLAKLKKLADEAHEDVVEGTFFNREIHERDRRAKFGGKGNTPPTKTLVNSLDTKNSLPNKGWKIASVSSESKGNEKFAANAIDGDPRTHWHTNFAGDPDEHPHEIVIDLGRPANITGVRYLARQDNGWNGAIAKVEIAVSNKADEFGSNVASTNFKKVKTGQELLFKAVHGRYVKIRALSEVSGGPWASAAEFGVVGTYVD